MQLTIFRLQSHQTIKKDEFYALLSVADLAVITPLRDGMNTTSMEFVIAQELTNKSPIVLSEFMGISSTMEEALQVNPWDLGVCHSRFLGVSSISRTPMLIFEFLTIRVLRPLSTEDFSCRSPRKLRATRSCTSRLRRTRATLGLRCSFACCSRRLEPNIPRTARPSWRKTSSLTRTGKRKDACSCSTTMYVGFYTVYLRFAFTDWLCYTGYPYTYCQDTQCSRSFPGDS